MSFILDALSKSERQTDGDKPNLTRVPGPRRSGRMVLVVALLLVVNLLVITGWLVYDNRDTPPAIQINPGAQQSSPPIQRAGAVSQPSLEATSDNIAQPFTATQQAVARGSVDAAASDSTTTRTDRTATPPDAGAVVAIKRGRIGELPASIQKRVPDMTFSSHIFADQPSLRMVNINGRNMREGDVVAPGLKLVEITEDGAAFGFLHYQFEMSVVRDWAY